MLEVRGGMRGFDVFLDDDEASGCVSDVGLDGSI